MQQGHILNVTSHGKKALILSCRNPWERSGSKPSSSPLHEEPSVIQTPTSDHILQPCRLQAVLKPLMKKWKQHALLCSLEPFLHV